MEGEETLQSQAEGTKGEQWSEERGHRYAMHSPVSNGNKCLMNSVLAGPPNSSVIRSLSLDLERRGFIVYIVCANMDEEQQVLSESRADVRPLHLDVVDTFGTEEAIDRFNAVLRRPHVAFTGASPHKRMCYRISPPFSRDDSSILPSGLKPWEDFVVAQVKSCYHLIAYSPRVTY